MEGIIAQWQHPLHAFAYRYTQNRTDADELVEEAFVRLYEHRERLRPDSNLSAWLYATVANLCRNHHRWHQRHPSLPLESTVWTPGSVAEPAEQTASPDAALDQDEITLAVRGAIESLGHDQKVALLLHHYEGLSYRQIAAITGGSERGVETRLYRAKQQLRDLLAPFLHEAATRK